MAIKKPMKKTSQPQHEEDDDEFFSSVNKPSTIDLSTIGGVNEKSIAHDVLRELSIVRDEVGNLRIDMFNKLKCVMESLPDHPLILNRRK